MTLGLIIKILVTWDIFWCIVGIVQQAKSEKVIKIEDIVLAIIFGWSFPLIGMYDVLRRINLRTILEYEIWKKK